MKRVLASDGRAVVLNVPEPSLRPGEIAVATAYSVISPGTELGIIRDTQVPGGAHGAPRDLKSLVHPTQPKVRDACVQLRNDPPRPDIPGTAALGYSLAGTVLAVSPEITDLRLGECVACAGNQCAFHAERVTAPRSLVTPVPDTVRLQDAAFVALGIIAMHAVRRSGCQFGETVVVYGLGPIGLLAAWIATQAGLYVMGLDIDATRLAEARSFGVHRVLNPRQEDAVATVLDMTEGFGADAVLLCVGTPSSDPVNLAFEMCRQRGCVVGVGAFGMNIERQKIHSRDIAFLPSLSYGPGRYDAMFEEGNVDYPIGCVRWTESRNMRAFVRLLSDSGKDLSSLAPMTVPVEEAPRAYEMLSRPDHPATIMLTYGQPALHG